MIKGLWKNFLNRILKGVKLESYAAATNLEICGSTSVKGKKTIDNI